MKHFKKASALLLAAAMACLPLTGCSSGESVRIIRIGHNQSTNHPTHIALTAFPAGQKPAGFFYRAPSFLPASDMPRALSFFVIFAIYFIKYC